MENLDVTNLDEQDKIFDHEYLMQQFTTNSETQLDILSVMASIMGIFDFTIAKNKTLYQALSITYDYLIELFEQCIKEKEIISDMLLNIKNKHDKNEDELEVWSDYDEVE